MTRDEHSTILVGDNMVVFGGFAFGQRSNEIFKYNITQNTWSKMMPATDVAPCPRAGHSAVNFVDGAHGDSMIIFGGKDDENNKLNDVWKFSFATREWKELSCDGSPMPRSGHTAQVYKNYMIIYAGIFEVCKELNDLHIFDMVNGKWVCLFEELNSPGKPSVEN